MSAVGIALTVAIMRRDVRVASVREATLIASALTCVGVASIAGTLGGR